MAPELFSAGIKKTRASDVYAFGMTILEVVTGLAPFQAYNHDMGVVMAITRGERPGRPGTDCMMYDELWMLATECWENNIEARPNMKTIAERLDSLVAMRAMGSLSLSSLDGESSFTTASSSSSEAGDSSMNMSRASLDTQSTLKQT